MSHSPFSRRCRRRASVAVLALALGACVKPEAQPVTLVFSTQPSPDVSQVAAAAVRLRVEDGQSSYLRSGVMIDPRGYVLTSFSSVGVEGISEGRMGSYGRPGTLYDAERVNVEVYDGPFASTPAAYVARVVRGDVRLNLALLRVIGTLDGALPPGHRFAAVDLEGATSTPRLGSSGLAIGAGANVASLTVRPATLMAGIPNSQEQIAGYLVDLHHATLDGAPYFDGDGNFAGVLSRGFLRPPERIPAEWRDELARGDIDDLRVVGVDRLEPGIWAEVNLIGDSPYRPSSDEARREVTEDFFYLLPNLQAGTIVTVPAVNIVAYRGGRSIASGTGEVFVAGEADVLVAVRMPRPNDPRGLRLRVRFEPLR
jgi:hypothetical protein